MLAKHALSQLSYGPMSRSVSKRSACHDCQPVFAQAGYAGHTSLRLRGCATRSRRRSVVGLGRLELPTSRLSSARSNQLSYKPLTLSSSKRIRDRLARKPALRAPNAIAQARQPLARVRPRRKRNVDGEIPPMQLNDPDDRWPLMFLKRFDRSKLLKNHP